MIAVNSRLYKIRNFMVLYVAFWGGKEFWHPEGGGKDGKKGYGKTSKTKKGRGKKKNKLTLSNTFDSPSLSMVPPVQCE